MVPKSSSSIGVGCRRRSASSVSRRCSAWLAVDLADRGRQQAAVRRDVEVVDHVTVGPGVDLVPLVVGVGDPDQRRDAVEVAHAPDRAVGRD